MAKCQVDQPYGIVLSGPVHWAWQRKRSIRSKSIRTIFLLNNIVFKLKWSIQILNISIFVLGKILSYLLLYPNQGKIYFPLRDFFSSHHKKLNNKVYPCVQLLVFLCGDILYVAAEWSFGNDVSGVLKEKILIILSIKWTLLFKLQDREFIEDAFEHYTWKMLVHTWQMKNRWNTMVSELHPCSGHCDY